MKIMNLIKGLILIPFLFTKTQSILSNNSYLIDSITYQKDNFGESGFSLLIEYTSLTDKNINISVEIIKNEIKVKSFNEDVNLKGNGKFIITMDYYLDSSLYLIRAVFKDLSNNKDEVYEFSINNINYKEVCNINYLNSYCETQIDSFIKINRFNQERKTTKIRLSKIQETYVLIENKIPWDLFEIEIINEDFISDEIELFGEFYLIYDSGEIPYKNFVDFETFGNYFLVKLKSKEGKLIMSFNENYYFDLENNEIRFDKNLSSSSINNIFIPFKKSKLNCLIKLEAEYIGFREINIYFNLYLINDLLGDKYNSKYYWSYF